MPVFVSQSLCRYGWRAIASRSALPTGLPVRLISITRPDVSRLTIAPRDSNSLTLSEPEDLPPPEEPHPTPTTSTPIIRKKNLIPVRLPKKYCSNKIANLLEKKEDGLLTETRPPRHVTDLVSSTKVYLAKPVSTYHYIYLSNRRANIDACKIRCFQEENEWRFAYAVNHA